MIVISKFRLFFLSIIFLWSSISQAALVKSNGTGGGPWNTNSTWVDENGDPLGRTPQDGDEIIIQFGDQVIISNRVPAGFQLELNNVTIAVRGNLHFSDNPSDFSVAGLRIDDASLIVVEENGEITSDGSVFEYINVDGSFPWSGLSPDIDGPAYIDDSNGLVRDDTPPGYTPLPIELIGFTAALSGSVVEVVWATAAEINNDFFTIERSEDGINWSIIGEEFGAGDSHVRLDYTFVDHNPIPGMSYYRLKQTDFDGQFEYFSPAVVIFELDNLFKVFPNPVVSDLNITTTSDLEDAIILVKNLNGQQEQVDVSLINGRQAQLDLGHLPRGVYLLEIVFGESTLSSRILKK